MDDPSFIFLGSGSQGCVGLIGGHPRIAAKFTRKDSNARVVAFSKECEALQILRHQNIIQYFGFDDDNPVYNVIRMEYCERGSLSAVLNDPTIVYSMKTVFCWCEHLLAALVYLEENGIVHRDIKPSNVLVKQDWVLKLADFGCVRDLFQKMNTSSVATLTGTYRYMSPEAYGIYRRKTFKRKINSLNDLYAIGLVIWEIVERRLVYAKFDGSQFCSVQLFNELSIGYRLEAIDCVNEELKKLVLRCTHPQPKQRPTINEAYNVARAQNHSHLTNNFEPIIDKNQSVKLRPIGFDGTDRLIAVESDINTITVPPIDMNPLSDTKEDETEVMIMKDREKMKRNPYARKRTAKKRFVAQKSRWLIFGLVVVFVGVFVLISSVYALSMLQLMILKESDANVTVQVKTQAPTSGSDFIKSTINQSTKQSTEDREIDECLNCLCLFSCGTSIIEEFCQNNTGTPSCGQYQITAKYYQDCFNLSSRPQDAEWMKCAHDLNCSKRCIKSYYQKYHKRFCEQRLSTCEKMTRTHQGGPRGCKNEATNQRWNYVKEKCPHLEIK